ncbi:hypothetical protein [Methylobacterium brachiatum]|uniref:hypothetical protein n=1 Tax=Methylobacterium brachiatum TaxID=269660 RepID=UPI0013CECABA|nr:hypothetical protein [Methylobacterium brachiatum]
MTGTGLDAVAIQARRFKIRPRFPCRHGERSEATQRGATFFQVRLPWVASLRAQL